MISGLLFIVLFLASLDGFVLGESGSFNIRMSPLAFPVLIFLFSLEAGRKAKMTIVTNQWFYFDYKFFAPFFLFILALLPLHIQFIAIDKFAAIKLVLLFIFNVAYFCSYFTVFKLSVSLASMRNAISLQILLVVVIVIFQLLLSFAGMYEPIKYGSEGWLNLGRPSAFFDDVGWLGVWVFGLLCVYVGIQKSLGKSEIPSFRDGGGIIISTVIVALISQSRILLLLIFLLIIFSYKINIKYIILLLVSFVVISIVIFVIGSISENIYYDILDLSRNPRLNDFYLVSDELDSRDAWLFGVGLGGGEILNETYEWRNMSSTLNVLPLSFIFETGILGLFIFLNVTYFLSKLLKDRQSKLSFALILFAMIFHNSIHKHFYWIILALIFWVDSLPGSSKDNCQ